MAMIENNTLLTSISPSSNSADEYDDDAGSVHSFDSEKLVIHTFSMSTPISLRGNTFDATSSIGLRPTQEDRFFLIPELFSKFTALAGVFDGTAGPHASEFVSKYFASHLLGSRSMQELLHITSCIERVGTSVSIEVVAQRVRAALRETFLSCDQSLLAMCATNNLHYVSSTGVAALLWNNLLTIAHVGDSKACIAKVSSDGDVHPEWLTIDHKPDQPAELARIQSCGGSLVWLHGNKPYIRGGDFARRQANCEHPKQLNYSRAFGGKDLKKYGLIVEPDINHFEIEEHDRLVLLASDGLWDVLSPKAACEIALLARKEGRNPTQAVVDFAIGEMPRMGVRDNITAVAIFLNDE